ncbi:hypothetical protein K466DRAFT_584583 [Polyporus arcularius HHB13444]|uniref:Uncharacterized protein n=1 Tax=Polyporus arcularius HHB13444 TaxID=1314778 RepID=A0A5C3PJM2_9APHY|nr:hypothetical protein K466DRAFT_584583 [Polyporus arcularius HHB13444]
MKRLSMLCLLALGRSTGTLLAHILFFWFARSVPAFDPSGALTSSSLRKTWYIGIMASCALLIPSFFSFFLPFALRYKACAAEGTLTPANKLRWSWTPAFWTPGVQHACTQIGTVVAFAGTSMVLRFVDEDSHYLDPFHAGALGYLGNLTLRIPMSGWQRVQKQMEREDEGDGVWRENEPAGRGSEETLL